MGMMVGFAITLVVEPNNAEHKKKNPNAWEEYRAYVSSVAGPKIVVVQDLDKPKVVGGCSLSLWFPCHHSFVLFFLFFYCFREAVFGAKSMPMFTGHKAVLEPSQMGVFGT